LNFPSSFWFLDNEPPDVHLLPVGVMHLARTQEEAEAFKNAWRIQMYVSYEVFSFKFVRWQLFCL
jgi:hypothetical protein